MHVHRPVTKTPQPPETPLWPQIPVFVRRSRLAAALGSLRAKTKPAFAFNFSYWKVHVSSHTGPVPTHRAGVVFRAERRPLDRSWA